MDKQGANDAPLARIGGEREEVAFSRPTDTSPFGKCEDRIDVPSPAALKELLAKLAMLEQKSLATYVRGVLEAHALLERERVKRIVASFGGDTTGMNL